MADIPRAPQADGECLIVPRLNAWPDLLATNRALWRGTPWAEWRAQAQAEVYREAQAYTARLLAAGGSTVQPVGEGEPVHQKIDRRSGDAPALAPAAAPCLLMTGHQPELFHPGVWVKNFLLHQQAQALDGVGLNLIVDSDLPRSVGIMVPDGVTGRATLVPFDDGLDPCPYEELPRPASAGWSSFPARVRSALRGADWEPLLDAYWAAALTGPDLPTLAEYISRGRRRLEATWGCHNLEWPVSRLGDMAAFGHFVGQLLPRSAELQARYNAALSEYRRSHRIRSRQHPAADLARAGDWVETPFWVWRAGELQRGRLLAQTTASHVALGRLVSGSIQPLGVTLPLHGASWRSEWAAVGAAGWKVRPRALVTAMLCRLLLAEIFIHGIGGAVYDRLADQIFGPFLGVTPPHFAVATATLRLPWPLPPTPPLGQLRQAAHRAYHEPRMPIEPNSLGRAARRAAFLSAHARKAAQRSQPAGPHALALAALAEGQRVAARRAVLGSRDYAAVLHPAERLQSLFHRLAVIG